MTYNREVPVEFNHCDPAGIVFYPRYFEMTNSVVENFFREVLAYPFARICAEGRGVPTARIEVSFTAPSRLGDVLDFTLLVERIGRTSVTFRIAAARGLDPRLQGLFTLVWLDAAGRPEPWPVAMRNTLSQHLTVGTAP
ncbi:MAG TPA: acyl-CoA thioesterase [Paracoccaceae bacterium]|nr:acyl-CoA thioesterase [Paracoccaceae bacterium]HMO70191.1 acyl-CoA thioesterase [Paracoccaceae bacterium]